MNWKRSLWGILLGVPLLALLAYGMTQDPRNLTSPLPGRAAPLFTLEVLGSEEEIRARSGGSGLELQGIGPRGLRMGDRVSLEEHRGDVVVLNFWASWCLTCRSEQGALANTALRYRDDDVYVYGLLYNDTPENARRYLRDIGGKPYPALVDPGARTAISYGLYGVPETFIIGPDGTVVYKHVGPVTEALLRNVIDPLLETAAQPNESVEVAS